MNRLFLRFFVLVMLSITAATVVIYFATAYFFGDPLEQIARKQAAAPIFLLEQYVDKAPVDDWLVRLNKVRQVSDFNFDLLPIKGVEEILEPSRRAALWRGEVVIDIPGRAFYRRVDLHGDRYVGSDTDVIHVTGLPIDVGLALKLEGLRYVIVALALLIPIAFWSRNHWRALQALSQAAEDFGSGKLATRIDMAPNAGVYPLAQCLNQMAERIQGLLEAHRNLLHSVSHELRTPIARIEFGLELLREESLEEAQPQARARFIDLQTDIDELKALVNELLDLTKLEQQRSLPQARFMLDDMLHDSVQAVAPILALREVEIQIAERLGELVGDRRLMTRALGNLLANAAKYGRHKVLLTAKRNADGSFEATVEDDGPGIAHEARQRIFEPFYRLDINTTQPVTGFGLGLAIAKKAITLHGGSILVAESALGGAKFVVAIP
ncbi:MAG TPA: ATP-binding protein [Burkholderiaceae bacterium]